MTKVNMDPNDVRYLRYYVLARCDETGDVTELIAGDNTTWENIKMGDISEAPDFVRERLALIKLTDVNKSNVRDIVGRKISDDAMIIYINEDEYNHIKEECK
jgi:hypothetical protein